MDDLETLTAELMKKAAGTMSATIERATSLFGEGTLALTRVALETLGTMSAKVVETAVESVRQAALTGLGQIAQDLAEFRTEVRQLRDAVQAIGRGLPPN